MDAGRLNLIYNSTYHFSLFYFNIILQFFSYVFQVVSSIMVLESIFSCRLLLIFLPEYYISYGVFIHSIIIGSTNWKASRLTFLQPPVTFPLLAQNILPRILIQNIFDLCSSPIRRSQLSHLHKIASSITFQHQITGKDRSTI